MLKQRVLSAVSSKIALKPSDISSELFVQLTISLLFSSSMQFLKANFSLRC